MPIPLGLLNFNNGFVNKIKRSLSLNLLRDQYLSLIRVSEKSSEVGVWPRGNVCVRVTPSEAVQLLVRLHAEVALGMNTTDTNGVKVINAAFMVEVQNGQQWSLRPNF